MNKPNDGGGAFPRNVDGHYFMGMTLRDYFAAKAMQAVIADADIAEIYDESPEANSVTFFDFSAITAYLYADAMLKAREQ